MVKNLPVKAIDTGDMGSTWVGYPGGGNGTNSSILALGNFMEKSKIGKPHNQRQ